MQSISNTTGPVDYGEAFGEDGDSSNSFAGKNIDEQRVLQANTISLITIFKYYNVFVDRYKSMTTCPFKSHKGGRESTASFKYFTDTNSFFCYGCKVGGKNFHACEFVSTFESISKVSAANKILNLFSKDINSDYDKNHYDNESYLEKINIIMDFSFFIKNARNLYQDEEYFEYLEYICKTYDTLNQKYSLNNEGLLKVIDKLKMKVNHYKK